MEQVRPKHKVDLRRQQAAASGNYLRILKLIPKIRENDQYHFVLHLPAVAETGGGPGTGTAALVETDVLERGPYTTLLRFQQIAQPEPELLEHDWSTLPVQMTVRVYHDAEMAEVVDFMNVRHFESSYEYPNRQMLLPDEKQQVNYFLADWLDRCLQFGLAAEPLKLAVAKS
ncbi:MAG: DUF1249 domain-containing protein [Pseudomonadales bacterium]|nr:DUF1249 domain-containing protein [Pseudomonadales bacterium]